MRGSVLIVEDDHNISSIVADILTYEGFAVSKFTDSQPEHFQQEIARLEPDVVLLDGWDGAGYGESWIDAAWLGARDRPIGVIMFTGQTCDLLEAQLRASERSRRAAFVGFIPKPFDIQILIDVVNGAFEEVEASVSLSATAAD